MFDSTTHRKVVAKEGMVSTDIAGRMIKILQDNLLGCKNGAITRETKTVDLTITCDEFDKFVHYIQSLYSITFVEGKNKLHDFNHVGELIDYIKREVYLMKKREYGDVDGLTFSLDALPEPAYKGSQSMVYIINQRVVKLFFPWQTETKAYREARKQMIAYQLGLKVPCVYDILDGERTAIVMDHIQGTCLGQEFFSDNTDGIVYIDKLIDAQIAIHKFKHVDMLLQQKQYGTRVEEATGYDQETIAYFRLLVDEITDQDTLCHGDLHLFNLIEKNGEVYIIDWQDACLGNPHVDIARSYMLYVIYEQDMADVYLDRYCKKTNTVREDILKWLPVNAAVRLCDSSKNILKKDDPTNENDKLLFMIYGDKKDDPNRNNELKKRFIRSGVLQP